MDTKESRIKYLMELMEDCRGEVKMRISQRDSFATQLLVISGTLLSLSLSLAKSYAIFLLWLIPFVTLFYSSQILSSYSIHKRLTTFLRQTVEPELKDLLAMDDKFFWQTYCHNLNKNVRDSGIRKKFFTHIMWIVPIVVAVIFLLAMLLQVDEKGHRQYSDLVIILSTCVGLALSEILAIIVWRKFTKREKIEKEKLEMMKAELKSK